MTRRIIVGLCSLGLVTTCGRDPSPVVPTQPLVVIVSITVSGPSLMQPGESSQFSLIGRFSDGTSREVTENVVWKTSNSVFSVTAAGLVTAVTAGESFISAAYQFRTAGLAVVSLPSGTGILRGTVKEASFPIAGATIQVVGGSFAGRSAISDGLGNYILYGVVGDLQIRATKDGYVAVTSQITVTPFSTPRRDQILDFNLNSAGPVVSLAGSYHVTLSVSDACSAKFPSEAQARNYSATVTQDGSRLTVVLSGAEFAVQSNGTPANRFEGRARADSAELALGDSSFYYYAYYDSWGFVERLGEITYLAVVGTAAGAATRSTITATLNGSLVIYEAAGGFYGRRRVVSSCHAQDHQLVFTRQ